MGKLFFLILLKLLHLDSGLAFQFMTGALIETSIWFMVIGVAILLYNLFSVVRAKPVELLYAARKGDHYNSFVGLKAFLGILCIGGAYAMILTTPSPIDVIGRVFPIAFLILVGTQLFFSFCCVVLLQALKRNEILRNQLVSNYVGATYENAEIERESDNYTFGGFLFIGLLLSLLFMIFLTLVIYYKQITEGYSDRCHFEVMQKIGLDRNEVSAIVHKEIRIMFFLPLLVAVIHLAASLYAVAMLLSVFGLTNVWVLALCAGTIFLLFVFIYIAMYFSTARTYCKIVMR